MKGILQAGAIVLHPIFLPLYSLFVYWPFVAGLDFWGAGVGLVWIGFVYLILPLVYFKMVRHINIAEPSLLHRRSIYRAYSLINFGFALVNVFLLNEYISFYIGAGFLHLFLWFLVYLELKASWHAAVWAFLVGSALMMFYKFDFVGMPLLLLVFLVLAVAVIAIRYLQKAHTPLELAMAAAVGVISSSFILFF
jgi:hypothetical protein